MKWTARNPGSATRPRTAVRTVSVLSALALTAAGITAATAPAQAAAVATAGVTAPAADTVVVHADQPFRPVTHVATGSLYGLADATTPSNNLVAAIKPNTFVQMPAGGKQQPTGDILQVAAKAQLAGAKVVDRLSDIYAGWPYQFSWSTWPDLVKQQVQEVQASGITNLASYALWNESDNTWLAANGTFEDFWTKTYREVRSLAPSVPIQGPSFSDNISDMRNFLQNAVATDTVPDILAWHELESSTKIAGDVATVEGIEKSLGIAPRPIAIEEYAAPAQVGIPGDLVGYIAKFERLGVDNAELAFWNQSGALGDLLTGRGGSPNGAYWLYTWYAGMSGNMVTTAPPSNTSLLDAAASVTRDGRRLDVITGGGSGQTAVTIDGLNKLHLGDKVQVKLEYTPSYGRTTATPSPITISDTTYKVGPHGAISVPIVMNPADGYDIVVTAGTAPHSGAFAGTYTATNLNSSLALATTGSGASGSLVDQADLALGSASQTWKLVDAGAGLYKVLNAASGLSLGIQDNATTPGAPALVWGDTSAHDDLWQIVPDGKGNVEFANYGTGFVLAVKGMSKAAGAQVIQWADGSATNTCTADGPRQPGKLGSALSFCDSGSYVRLPTGVVSSLTGAYTVSAWVNPASNAAWQRLFDIGNGASASMFLTLNDGTDLRYAITTGGAGGEQRIDGTGTLPLDQWSLVTVTFSGTTGTLYINGKVAGTNTNMTDEPSAFGASTANYIGKSQYGSDPALDATVDDFNIYNRALSPAEVADLATAGQAGAGNVVHYTFDEAGGAAVPDSSGNGDNATIVTGSTSTTTTAPESATADHWWTLTPESLTRH